ncbi:hypothetical protein MBIO_0026 [Mycoplasmopsis fermentans PG18]|uniref:Uncharacterized protein n=2 Tax=Mycoplasmopsis fermentans TaxID=2115 RepID=C4XDR9_MYCFP|nr:hypothetical protein [Mycoplasmopsis fermentans]ADV34598.1 Hypothetical Protein MfeM64YM_0600 [Mycoplasmopsis fermentans M64]BAH69291.1 hypothetical protein MBIO_0026 [Mycoplasmopsis fermentans PG18]VEU63929.1 Uncharacterised protein [Mycoplasmopsis fermentans]VEU67081.1 Uncharacterised protein [Mesomycoplasma conjunctivae]
MKKLFNIITSDDINDEVGCDIMEEYELEMYEEVRNYIKREIGNKKTSKVVAYQLCDSKGKSIWYLNWANSLTIREDFIEFLNNEKTLKADLGRKNFQIDIPRVNVISDKDVEIHLIPEWTEQLFLDYTFYEEDLKEFGSWYYDQHKKSETKFNSGQIANSEIKKLLNSYLKLEENTLDKIEYSHIKWAVLNKFDSNKEAKCNEFNTEFFIKNFKKYYTQTINCMKEIKPKELFDKVKEAIKNKEVGDKSDYRYKLKGNLANIKYARLYKDLMDINNMILANLCDLVRNEDISKSSLGGKPWHDMLFYLSEFTDESLLIYFVYGNPFYRDLWYKYDQINYLVDNNFKFDDYSNVEIRMDWIIVTGIINLTILNFLFSSHWLVPKKEIREPLEDINNQMYLDTI